MLQESSFARQTRRRLSSLEAVQPRRRVLARWPVSLISRICNLGRSKRSPFATAGPSRESPKGTGTLRTQAFTWVFGVQMEEEKCFSQQSRMGRDRLPIADVGDLETT